MERQTQTRINNANQCERCVVLSLLWLLALRSPKVSPDWALAGPVEKARALEDLWIRGAEEIFDSGLAGVPIEQMSILLGHSNIKVTQQHYNPWVRDRQLQLEADLQCAWNRDAIVLLNSNAGNTEQPQLILPN